MQNRKFNQIRLVTRQFATSEENVAFDFQSRCICALFTRSAKARGAELPDAWGLVGDYRHEPPRVVPGDGRLASVIQPDDVTGVMSLPGSERKRAFLHLVLRTLDTFFAGRTPQPFLDAAADVRAADFVNTWTWKAGGRRSPDRRWRSAVSVLHDLHEYQIRLEILDTRAMPVFEQLLVRCDKPDEMLIHFQLGELEWAAPRRIVLHSRLPGEPPLAVELPASLA
jgi:hypothetical protein